MSYYFFNRCEKTCERGIEKIANELGLTEKETSSKTRFWSGKPLAGKDEFYREIIIYYNPKSELPLSIQTNVESEKRKKVKKIVKSLIDLCKPTEIYQEPVGIIKYDLKDFEN